jgi:DNA-directed RNA polymerase omega subunit
MDIQRWDRAKEKVGRTFELTVLVQKRVRELVRDKQRPLVDLEHRNPIQIALEEILQDKIYLAPAPAQGEMSVAKAPAPTRAPASPAPVSADPTAAPAGAATDLLLGLDEALEEGEVAKRRSAPAEASGETSGSVLATD